MNATPAGSDGHTTRWLPALGWLRTYQRRWLRGDLVAGVVVAALLVPQALGYAGIAGVPLEVGLYGVPLALVAYAVLGSSRQLVVGPASTVSLVSGSLVATLADGDSADAVAYTTALAIATGLVLVVVGLARVGWVAEFLSKPIVTGFVFGLTVTIVIGELPALLGIPKPGGQLLGQAWSILTDLVDADTTTLLVSVAALVVLFGGGWLAPRVPWGLVTLVLGIVVSSVLDLADEGVAIVGEVPGGLPPVGLPAVPVSSLPDILLGGVSLALVGLAEGLSAARLFAVRGGYRIDADQEFLATGAANVAAGFTGGLTMAGSLSKTATAARSGGRTQVVGVTAAVLVVVVLLVAAQVFTDLPRAVLSAIVVNAVWRLMDRQALRRYARVRRADFVTAVAALVGVLVFGPLNGLLVAIGISILAIIVRSGRSGVEVMGKISGEKAAWGRIAKHPDRTEVPGVMVVRLAGPLFWVNAAAMKAEVEAELDARPDTLAVVVDMEASTQLDTTSVDVLVELLAELRDRDIELYLVRVFHTARHVLRRAGFLDLLGDDHVWHSISQGVKHARHELQAQGRWPGAEEAPEADVADHEEHIAAESHLGEEVVDDAEDESESPPTAPVDLNVERLASGIDWVGLARREPVRDGGSDDPDGQEAGGAG